MKQIFSLGVFIILLVVSIGVVTPTDAEAACSYTGYLNSNGTCANSFNYQYQQPLYTYPHVQYQQTADLRVLEQYIQQLLQILAQLQAIQDGSVPYYGTDGYAQVDVVTRSADSIDDDRATLRGEVDFNNEDEATVYFQYGRSANSLTLETVHVVLDDNDDERFTQQIRSLRNDTTYYFRAVAEDENGDRDYGSILSFTTDRNGGSNDDYDDTPTLDTDSARNITEDSAELRGSVDMNDFNNGQVFFVWGEDENQIDDIERDYDTYSDIDEDGDDLQKVSVDSDLDDDDSYTYIAYGLDDDTDIYFAICVGYEDEDDDDVINCGNIEDFTTDRN